MSAFGFRELMCKPEDLGQRVGLALHRNPRTPEFFPRCDDYERQQHGVDDAQDSVDEASYVVLPLAHFYGHEALHHRQPNYRGEASPTNDQDAINYAHCQSTIPLIVGELQNTSWRM